MILFAAPGFYHGAETIDDLVDFVVARILDQLGLDNTLDRAVGPDVTHESGTLPAEGVRSMFDRIAPVYDVMNRVMTVGLDQRWRRLTVRIGRRGRATACSTRAAAPAISRSRRARPGGEVVGLDFSERDARARAAQGPVDRVDRRATCSSCRSRTRRFDAATVGFGVRNVADLERGLAELRRVLRPGGRLGILEITRPRGPLRPFFRLWFDVLIPLAGKILPGGKAYTYLPASVRRFPGPDELAGAAAARRASRDVDLPAPRRRDRRAAHGDARR